jgi:hypothetical protein
LPSPTTTTCTFGRSLASDAASDSAAARLAVWLVGRTPASAWRSATWSPLRGASTDGTSPIAISVIDWSGWSPSIISETRAWAAARRLGATSVACIEAESSSRTIASGPMASELRTYGRASATTPAASARSWTSSSRLGGMRRHGRRASSSSMTERHSSVLAIGRLERRGLSR